MEKNSPPSPVLFLGSGSTYRRDLLNRLGLPFEVFSPDVDELALANEKPLATSQRLAQLKAKTCAQAIANVPKWQGIDFVVIGSDQVAELNNKAIGKPGTHENAMLQLQTMRRQKVLFHTSVTVIRPQISFEAHATSTAIVLFRDLSDKDIDTYLRIEHPYDCAGSAKAEGLGICLLERIESDDPTALIGLPLIATAQLLRQAGLDPLSQLSNNPT